MDSSLKKKRICFAVYRSDVYGGVETVARNLSRALSKDYDVYYLGLIGNQDIGTANEDNQIREYNLLPIEASKKKLRQQAVLLFRDLSSFLKRERIDLLVLMGHYPAFLASAVRAFTKVKFIFCDHGALINQIDDKKTTLMRFIAAKICDKTVLLTEKSLSDYKKILHIRDSKLINIYNWVEPSKSDSKKYDKYSKKIISVGRLSSEKGFDQLFRAMSIVKHKHPEWSLDVYGDGDMENSLSTIISNLDLAKTVTLKGRDDYVRARYKDYAMYVMPSYREGLPLTLIEAKLNMLPIVAFDVDTGPREIVRNEVDGLLVEKQNIGKLADAICRLIEDVDLRIRFSEETKGNLFLFEKENIIPLWKELFNATLEYGEGRAKQTII